MSTYSGAVSRRSFYSGPTTVYNGGTGFHALNTNLYEVPANATAKLRDFWLYYGASSTIDYVLSVRRFDPITSTWITRFTITFSGGGGHAPIDLATLYASNFQNMMSGDRLYLDSLSHNNAGEFKAAFYIEEEASAF